MHSSKLIDLVIVAVCFGASLLIGAFFSRRQHSTSSYFLGDKKMPGWLVGFSITATISAMTFLANPGYSFQNDLRWVLPNFAFVAMAVFSMFFVAPYFRKVVMPSGYDYLERRFGAWARVYAATGFLLFKLLRLGIVLYVTSITLEVFLDLPAIWLMVAMGIVATIYTMAGGFEAVVWTEFFQAIMLIAGALVLLPMVLHFIPGGVGEVVATALPAGKMSLGSMNFSFTEKTVWVMIISSLFVNASDFTTRQDFIQRMRAPRSLGQARLALTIGACTVVPLWLYFNFLGTSLWVLYDKFPDANVAAFAVSEPEKIVPYFMATRLPAGISGLVLAGVLMASLGSSAPVLNASAVTWTSDFYQRFIAPGRDEKHYLRMGRISTAVFGVIMIILAIIIHWTRTQTLQDLFYTISVILAAGLFGLFMLGFFSRRTTNRAAFWASLCTITLTLVWLALASAPVQKVWPSLKGWMPDLFWVPVFSNILLPALALFFNRFTPEAPPDVDADLTYRRGSEKSGPDLKDARRSEAES
jgi:SSS family solute:Na+ symporter